MAWVFFSPVRWLRFLGRHTPPRRQWRVPFRAWRFQFDQQGFILPTPLASCATSSNTQINAKEALRPHFQTWNDWWNYRAGWDIWRSMRCLITFQTITEFLAALRKICPLENRHSRTSQARSFSSELRARWNYAEMKTCTEDVWFRAFGPFPFFSEQNTKAQNLGMEQTWRSFGEIVTILDNGHKLILEA